jgi:hypothetical protein
MKCDDLAVCEKGFTRVKSAALDMAFNPIMSQLERAQYVISSVEMPLCAFWLTVAQGGCG